MSTPKENKRSCCCCPCRFLCKCTSCIAHTLCVREAEDYARYSIKQYAIPVLITLLLTTSIGLMIKDGLMQATQVAWETSSVVIQSIQSIPEYMAPTVELMSSTWNATYTAVSITGNTVSLNAYNILAPFINKTSELSSQLQQKYETLVPYMNQTVIYLRKKDEDKLT